MKPVSRVGDRVFSGLSSTIAILLAVLVLVIFAFLIWRAVPALSDDSVNFFTSRQWVTDESPLQFGIQALLWTTVISSILALLVAVPLAIGIALFITQLAPKKLAGPVAFVVDLLAAVPSIVYGLWGGVVLGSSGVVRWIRDIITGALGWIPLFKPVDGWADPTGTIFLASQVLAIMILPIITAVSRDVMLQTPRDQIEAAMALGSTRWEVIRLAVLPHSKSGIISGSMLGLGRALGETLAVTLILQTISPMQLVQKLDLSIFTGGETFASKIARDFSEATNDPKALGALVASALSLFVITFIVNAAARLIAERGVKR
ncbi:phosphate ABC transporter permease subunit PstC [Acidipropionibacterium timonense]|uniref:phosphate ABC transporter permease subunit PstC n=1 Tax=Acidipropionibacterium timonense TaxID=2161818 RepID=UPI001030298F|nr:phosphate ABC transporter permease subunit PstC [Acidipropionibacterium timonense]